MTDSSRGSSAGAAAKRTQGKTSAGWEHLQGDEIENCEDCGHSQGPEERVVSCARSPCDEEDGGDSQGEVEMLGEPGERADQEEQIAHIDESSWNLRNIRCFVELTVIFVEAKVRRYVAFVLRPLMIPMCLLVTHRWRCSLWPLTELNLGLLTLITHLADVDLTVNFDGTPENMRDVTEIMLFVVYVLSVLFKLLFGVWQFFKCHIIVKMMWDRVLTPPIMDAFEISDCLVCIPNTLPYLYRSMTCKCVALGPKSFNCTSNDVMRSCENAYGAISGEEQTEMNQMRHNYGPHVAATLFQHTFAAFVWVCALYVALLVTVTVFKMILETVTDVLTLYTSYTIDRRSGTSSRSKALHDAVQQCLREKDSPLLDRTKWCLHQLTSRNRGYGAAVEQIRR